MRRALGRRRPALPLSAAARLRQSAVTKHLEDGALWISGSDLECMRLADVFPHGHPNLLTPPAKGLARIAELGGALPIVGLPAGVLKPWF